MGGYNCGAAVTALLQLKETGTCIGVQGTNDYSNAGIISYVKSW